MSLIGLMCKYGDVFSLQVLIGRLLFLLFLLYVLFLNALFILDSLVGAFSAEVPPVPIPNTVVKLSCAYNTWLVTAWEDRSVPTPTEADLFVSFCFLFNDYCLKVYRILLGNFFIMYICLLIVSLLS